jgi:molecular chaperone IbpA
MSKDFEWFDKFFDNQVSRNNNFPRTSIFIGNDAMLTFQFALAGYTKDDIQISFSEDKLSIIGRKENKPLEARKVIQNQIAYRDFEVVYRLPSEYVFPTSTPVASFKDGILEVKLEARTTSATKIITIN